MTLQEKIRETEKLIDENIFTFMVRNDFTKLQYDIIVRALLCDLVLPKSIINDMDSKLNKTFLDIRSKEELFVEAILNRIREIYISEHEILKDRHYELSGSDKNFIITKEKSCYPDLQSTADGRVLEVSSNYSLFAYNEGRFFLRFNKLMELIELSKDKVVELVQLSIPNRKIQIIRINENTKYNYISKLGCFGDKWGYEIFFEKENWISL